MRDGMMGEVEVVLVEKVEKASYGQEKGAVGIDGIMGRTTDLKASV